MWWGWSTRYNPHLCVGKRIVFSVLISAARASGRVRVSSFKVGRSWVDRRSEGWLPIFDQLTSISSTRLYSNYVFRKLWLREAYCFLSQTGNSRFPTSAIITLADKYSQRLINIFSAAMSKVTTKPWLLYLHKQRISDFRSTQNDVHYTVCDIRGLSRQEDWRPQKARNPNLQMFSESKSEKNKSIPTNILSPRRWSRQRKTVQLIFLPKKCKSGVHIATQTVPRSDTDQLKSSDHVLQHTFAAPPHDRNRTFRGAVAHQLPLYYFADPAIQQQIFGARTSHYIQKVCVDTKNSPMDY